MTKRVLLGLAILVLGVGLAFGGGRKLYRAFVSARWPEAEATVLASTVEPVQGQQSVRFRPSLRYTYQVEGRSYTSDVLAFGSGALETDVKREAEAYVRRHAEGTRIRVRYSPEEPGLACVECGKAGLADYVVTAGGLALALFAGSGLRDLIRVQAQVRRHKREAALTAGGGPQRSP